MQTSFFLRFIASRFLAALGDQVLLFAVPLIIYTETKSVTLAGLAFFIEWTPRVLSLPVAGSLSDRMGGRIVYLAADLVRGIAAIIAFYLLTLEQNLFVVLSTLMAVVAFFYAQSFIAMESMVPKLATKEELPKVQSWLQGIEQASLLLGPMIGSLFVIYTETFYLIPLAGALYLAGYLGILSLELPEVASKKLEQSGFIDLLKKVKADFIKAWTIVRLRPNLLLLTLMSISVNLIIGTGMATAAMMATGYFGASKTDFGIQQSFTGGLTLMVLMILPFVVHKINVFWVGIMSYLAICLASLVIGVTSFFWVYVFCYASIIAAGDLFNVYIRTERALLIPKMHLGKTIGLIVFLNQLTLPLSGIIVSLSPDEASTKSLFGVIGGLSIGVIMFCFSRLKSHSKILLPQES